MRGRHADAIGLLSYPVEMVPRDICLCRESQALPTHHLRLHRWIVALVLVVVQTAASARAQEHSTDELHFFESKIRPVLVERCYGCHSKGADEIEGSLQLDTRAGIRQGGSSGPAVVPNNPTGSLLLTAIRYESFEMPPEGKLPPHIIEDFERWIRRGASDPRDGDIQPVESSIDLERGREFWAFKPPKAVSVPSVQDKSWPATEIDRFILSGLEAKELQPAPDAKRHVLLRRIYYALIGLPPTPSELEEFVEESGPLSESIARVVDRLLDSKQFGERWGRHWLDVVRYADSSGGGRSALFPHAWRYRDYVIDAFNRDLPFDQFLREQIAGDLMESTDWLQRRRRMNGDRISCLRPD